MTELNAGAVSLRIVPWGFPKVRCVLESGLPGLCGSIQYNYEKLIKHEGGKRKEKSQAGITVGYF
jgi:hypothetical protein